MRATFADNFARRDEIGCVTVAGRTVVYLWGGHPRDGRPWRTGPMVNVSAVGKGLSALAAARLFEEAGSPRTPPSPATGRASPGAAMRHVLSRQAGRPPPSAAASPASTGRATRPRTTG
ncbi:hypothetical protein GCM10022214_44760 [Actinomadura miaoliensis]|uniref:Beta-lactamase family protein n=1 Tax=Actinomadura miaoliensis TaxID=430685 RepID=A0ABP7W4U6_9ACTN